MTQIQSGRKTTTNDQDLVIFLIGARVNKWWLLPFSLPIVARMRKMEEELLQDPNSGLLGIQSLGSAGAVQYWRSLDELLVYAEAKQREHQPTVKKFYQKIFKNEAVGVWHETFVVRAGHYEALYLNMPTQGLGKVLPLIDAKGEKSTTRGRLCEAAQS